MRGAMMAAVSLAIAVGVQAQTTETTVTGYVTDTYCGRRGANDKHAEHARRSVASGVAQYAIYVEAQPATAGTPQRGVLYILAPQSTAAQYVGQRVQISGTLSTTPIKSAGQSLAPDAVAAYKDPSAPNGLRATGATSGTTTAISGEARVQLHEEALDKTTPVGGVLTISSVGAPPPRPGKTQQ